MTARPPRSLIGLTLLAIALLVLAGCAPQVPPASPQTPHPTAAQAPTDTAAPAEQPASTAAPEPSTVAGTLTAHFFDVGQGDATLLAGPDFTILIDAGRHDRRDVVPHLQAAGIEAIDLLIGTHPHADHIGQFPQVLETFPVSEVWMSGDEHTSRTFERALDAVLASDAAYHEPRAGEVYDIGSARVEVLNRPRLTGDFHEGCIAVRVVFGDVAFLVIGDAERHTELAMIERRHTLPAQVLQLGHHGSRTSSARQFLEAVGPEVAIYSAGKDNPYGHPPKEVVERVAQLGIQLFGTSEHGTIRVITDGRTYQVQMERQQPVRGPPAEPVAGDCGPGQVNINTTSQDELMRIVHIGAARAEQLIQLRPYRSLDELRRINGIGAGRLREIKQQGLACVQ